MTRQGRFNVVINVIIPDYDICVFSSRGKLLHFLKGKDTHTPYHLETEENKSRCTVEVNRSLNNLVLYL